MAIAFAAISVAIGMAAIVLNGASYNSDFSTIFRASRTAEMSEEATTEANRCQRSSPT